MAVLLVASALCGACAAGAGGREEFGASEKTPTVPGAAMRLEPGEYPRAFEEMKAELRELGFTLERVDAQLGVISTQPKGTGGIATPWDQEQSGMQDRMEDALQRHRRAVRVEFTPAAGTGGSGTEVRDLRRETGPIETQVSVAVYQDYVPGWRLNTQAILESSYTHDPKLDERSMSAYAVAIRQDGDLARRIVENLRARLAKLAAQPKK